MRSRGYEVLGLEGLSHERYLCAIEEGAVEGFGMEPFKDDLNKARDKACRVNTADGDLLSGKESLNPGTIMKEPLCIELYMLAGEVS